MLSKEDKGAAAGLLGWRKVSGATAGKAGNP